MRSSKLRLKTIRRSSVNAGPAIAKPHVEKAVLDYYEELRENDLAVSTRMLIVKAKSIDATFHGGSIERLTYWVYDFLERYDLSIRTPTRQSQKTSQHLEEVKNDFLNHFNGRFLPFGTLANVPLENVVNMDETPVYFEPDILTTIAKKGSKTVPARKCSSNVPRVTCCLAVTCTGMKLPQFVVFKGVPGARIESSMRRAAPNGLLITCQENAWMDSRTTQAWIDAVWKPFVHGKEATVLLMDDYKCHKLASVSDALSELSTELEILPGMNANHQTLT
ncbi:hypothetical protein LEN26_009286 [Aphanomyces euteiches]|nr:hypothetical protein LEN26_009286 [Aphanomyces euteiches]KAH9184083.1 hypothetical protein AeNC1_013939 [Aphanomyces euteiches]